MKALSIKQPWASLIAYGIKDIENRTWKTNFRGRIYIHASGQITKGLYSEFIPKEHWESLTEQQKNNTICFSQLTSAIIGEVDIIDCVINHPSIWAEQTEGVLSGNKLIYKDKQIYNWVLTNPILYHRPILNVKGKLSLWEPTPNEICVNCKEEFFGHDPQYCCNGRDCGCMGLSTEPVLCNTCYNSIINRNKNYEKSKNIVV